VVDQRLAVRQKSKAKRGKDTKQSQTERKQQNKNTYIAYVEYLGAGLEAEVGKRLHARALVEEKARDCSAYRGLRVRRRRRQQRIKTSIHP
jgi:hypothetical protein